MVANSADYLVDADGSSTTTAAIDTDTHTAAAVVAQQPVTTTATRRQTGTVYRRISIVNGPVLPGVDRGVAVLPPMYAARTTQCTQLHDAPAILAALLHSAASFDERRLCSNAASIFSHNCVLLLCLHYRLGVCCEGTYVLHLTSTSTCGASPHSTVTRQDTVLELAAQALCGAANVKELWHLSFEMQPTSTTSATSHSSSTSSSSSGSSSSSNIVVLNRSAPSVYLHGPVEAAQEAFCALGLHPDEFFAKKSDQPVNMRCALLANTVLRYH
eukprot:4633-Heterococcus_DN1.PRE.2